MAVASLVGFISPRLVAAQTTTTPSADARDSLALHDAVVRFQNAWGIDLSYNATLLEGKWTRWIRPEKTSPEEDLRVLLQGTGIASYRLSSGTYGLRSRNASSRGSLSGYVFDALTGTPLPGAHVYFVDTQRGAVSNTSGLFALDALPPGEYVVYVSHLGYARHQQLVQIRPGQHSDLHVDLKILPIPLAPAIVYGPGEINTTRNPLEDFLSGDALSQISNMGTADLIHSINDISGVRVGDATSEIHIQGGDRGEHQFLLDGGLVFEPVHLFGLLGAFNPFAIGRITVDKAGFSASKGSYLAGVINADHAVVDTDQHPLDVQLDPLSFNARLNMGVGSTEGMHAEFMGAFRTSVWDGYWSGLRSDNIDDLLVSWNAPDLFLLRASLFPLRDIQPIFYDALIERLDVVPPPDIPDLNFNDIHLAGRLHLKNSHSFRASYYRGGNKLHGRLLVGSLAADDDDDDAPDPDRYDWVNENGQVTWSFLASSRVFISTQLRSSFYRLNHQYSGLDRQNAENIPFANRLFIGLAPADDGNRMRETALEWKLDYDHWGGYLKTGFSVINSRHRFTINDIFPQRIDHGELTSRVALFAEEKLTAIPRLTITGGSRLTYLGSRATVYAEPRLEARYTTPLGPVGVLSVRGAGGIYYQFLNQFDVSTISPSTLFPSTRFWMPVDESLPPPKAYHLAADIGLKFAKHWSFRAEGYYKDQPRLFQINYPSLWQLETETTEGEEPVALSTQADFITLAKGFAYGSAFVLERAGPKLRTSARYEYNIAEREYAFRDSVRTEPVPWSEPHRLEFAVDWTPHPNFIATARWRGGWGRVWGFRQAYYDFLATDVAQGLNFEGYDFRFPTDPEHQLEAFKQLDLGVAYTQPIGPTAIQLRVDVLNVTNRKNAADQSLFEQVAGEDIGLITQTRYLLPRTLSVSARMKW